MNSIQGIEEVNMIKDDGRVLHFTNPKVQASLSANTFAISGNPEDKRKIGDWIIPYKEHSPPRTRPHAVALVHTDSLTTTRLICLIIV